MIGNYFVGIVTASVVLTLLSMLYPADNGGVRKVLDLFLSLTLLCVILAPLGSMIAKAREEIDLDIFDDMTASEYSSDSAVYESLAEASREQIEDRLAEMLLKEFGGEIEVHAEVEADGGGVRIKQVTLVLHGLSIWEDPRRLRDFIGRFTDAEILIVNGG